MKKFRVKVDEKVYEVEVEEIAVEDKNNSYQDSNQTQKDDQAPKNSNTYIDKTGDNENNTEGEKIVAPLPGTISLEKKQGDSVSEGEVIFVLEAMKMENEITAPKAGTIKTIYVSAGDSVDTGDLLAVIG